MISSIDKISRAKRLKSLLALKGITQVKIAQEAGVHRTMVTNFIRRGEMSAKVYRVMLKHGIPARYLKKVK